MHVRVSAEDAGVKGGSLDLGAGNQSQALWKCSLT